MWSIGSPAIIDCWLVKANSQFYDFMAEWRKTGCPCHARKCQGICSSQIARTKLCKEEVLRVFSCLPSPGVTFFQFPSDSHPSYGMLQVLPTRSIRPPLPLPGCHWQSSAFSHSAQARDFVFAYLPPFSGITKDITGRYKFIPPRPFCTRLVKSEPLDWFGWLLFFSPAFCEGLTYHQNAASVRLQARLLRILFDIHYSIMVKLTGKHAYLGVPWKIDSISSGSTLIYSHAAWLCRFPN